MQHLEDLKSVCRESRGSRPLTVAVIGSSGVGKSSFINTVCAALSGRWREHAYSGCYGGEAKPMSMFVDTYVVQFSDCPNIAGFPNEDTAVCEELLRIVLYGRLAKGESLNSAFEESAIIGADGLRNKYKSADESLKVDRVVFVGAANQQVPKNLINCVIQAARPQVANAKDRKRTIPVYGVLTKCDLTPEGDTDVEKEFVSALGLDGSKHRFLRCRNYCDAVDGGKRTAGVIPEIDVPVLQFLTQVCDPVVRVDWQDQTYTGSVSGAPPEAIFGPTGRLVLLIVLEGLLCAVIASVHLPFILSFLIYVIVRSVAHHSFVIAISTEPESEQAILVSTWYKKLFG